uniref:Uncharacterized protein n=1 Tax=Oryza punctata TaxID=4537 RepID=A0A0E0JRR4_ORYPU
MVVLRDLNLSTFVSYVLRQVLERCIGGQQAAALFRELFNLEALEHEVHYEPEEVPNSHKLAIRECPVQSNRVLQRGPNGLAM